MTVISADAIRGNVDLLVLALLRSGPSYAYKLAQCITEVAGEDYSIKQATLYSAVKRLESGGHVRSSAKLSSSGKPRTNYRITDLGQRHLDLKLEEWRNTKSVVDRFVDLATGIARP